MRRRPLGWYAAALAILVVRLTAYGMPSTLLFAVGALACPLMMMLMMSGMRGGHGTERLHWSWPRGRSTLPTTLGKGR